MNALRTLAFSIAAAGLVAAAPAAAQMAAPSTSTTAVPIPPPPAAVAQDATGAGWNTQYGMLFSLQNVFVNSDILNNYGGGVGLQYNLAPQSALRFSVRASRTSNPPYEATSTYPGGSTKTLVVPSGWLSTLGVGVSGSYLARLTSSALAPYVGAGVSLNFDQNSRNYQDTINTPGHTINVDDYARTYGLGVIGQLGLEWRVHKSVSLFAEYGLSVDAFSATQNQTYRKDASAVGTTETKTSGTQTKFFNFGTGLVQGGSLGVVAFF
jgi:hypothetical protein